MTDFVVPVSQEESTAGALTATGAQRTKQALEQGGCAILRGVFPPAFTRLLREEFFRRYPAQSVAEMAQLVQQPPPNPVLQVGVGRFEVNLAMTGPFGDPSLFANPLLLGVLREALGKGCEFSSFSIVVSYPGALAQHIHRDHDQLYGDHGGRQLPAHAINVAVPLIDVDEATGPTGIFPGTHRDPDEPKPDAATVTTVPFREGDCVLLDYRTLHMGLPNRSTRVRPILYMVYARPWFFDELNHRKRPPVIMPLDTFERLELPVKHLMIRAWTQQVRASYLRALPSR